MRTYSVDILNPKAVRLLEDLADLKLISLRQLVPATSEVTDNERKQKAREAVLNGSPDMNLDAMLAYVRESRQDRKLPFRDDE